MNRRFSKPVPKIVGRNPQDYARELEDYIRSFFDEQSGIPAGFIGTTPSPVLVGETASAGALTDGWMSAGAQLVLADPGAPAGLDNTNIEGTSTAAARADHQHKRTVRVRLNGADIGTRNALNFIAPAGTVLDDAGNDEVDVDLLAAIAAEIAATLGSRGVGFTIDGGGAVITTGVKGYLQVPFGGTISRWTVLADVVGSIVIDVWKDVFASFPPTVADTIAGSEKPTLSAAQSAEDTALTTWTTAVTAGDCFAFNVDSASTVTKVTLVMWVDPA